MLVYETPEKLLAEPDARRYLHTVILTALRDKAERVEVRFGEDGGMLYYRVEGRDWELLPPPDDVYPVLKQTIREAARLVRPERPETTILLGTAGARFEPLEVGWLTYQVGGYWADLIVRIDFDNPEDFADAAGDALAALAEALPDDHDDPDDTALEPNPT